MKQKKVPARMCLGCREMKPKKELMRIVKDKDGAVLLDHTGKRPGRGAYICRNIQCFDKVRKGRKIDRAFECQVAEDVYKELRDQLEGLHSEMGV